MTSCELSIVLPCLDESKTLGICIDKARTFLTTNGITGEIIVADNGSSDGSQAIAKKHGARVVTVSVRGYGAALMEGIRAAEGQYVIFGDADDSYDFSALDQFVSNLRAGQDLVMGNRFQGGIEPGAMPALHRYLGNPVLTGIGRVFFKSPVGDFHCGLRGINKRAIQELDLQTTGMEFASEMVVKATLHRLRIAEVPTTLSRDGRGRPSHLRTWRDGWRHLRFLLIYSPRWLFLYPGIVLMFLGVVAMGWLFSGPKTIHGITFDIHTMLYASLSIILGLQAAAFALFSKVFGINARLLPEDDRIVRGLAYFPLELGIVIGGVLSGLGLVGTGYAVAIWAGTFYGPLVPTEVMRITIPSLTLIVSGAQIIFSSFFLSILRLKSR